MKSELLKKDRDIILRTNRLLESLGIEPSEGIENFLLRKRKRLYSTKVRFLSNNKTGMFRYSLIEKYNQHIRREARIYKLAKELEIDQLPNLIDHGVYEGYDWLIYEYIPGSTVGNTYEFKKDHINYDKIISFLKRKTEMTNLIPKEDVVLAHGIEYWSEILTKLQRDKSNLKDNKAWLDDIFTQIDRNIFHIKTKVLSHGDLHPENIILTENGELKIIDWETAKIGSQAIDYAFLWVRCHNESIRKKIWKYLIEEEKLSEKETAVVFSVYLIRDYLEWHSVSAGNNDYLTVEKIIGNSAKNIEGIEKKLIELKGILEK